MDASRTSATGDVGRCAAGWDEARQPPPTPGAPNMEYVAKRRIGFSDISLGEASADLSAIHPPKKRSGGSDLSCLFEYVSGVVRNWKTFRPAIAHVGDTGVNFASRLRKKLQRSLLCGPDVIRQAIKVFPCSGEYAYVNGNPARWADPSVSGRPPGYAGEAATV